MRKTEDTTTIFYYDFEMKGECDNADDWTLKRMPASEVWRIWIQMNPLERLYIWGLTYVSNHESRDVGSSELKAIAYRMALNGTALTTPLAAAAAAAAECRTILYENEISKDK
ncbi:hypothetical protein M0804_002039 [Polistes exclamans]|nr:hypothetical protein M0804_002039 [Polistes exclamans]